MTPERRRQIAASDLFVALATDHYFATPACHEDLGFARELRLRVVWLIRHGTTVPPGTIKDGDEVFWWTTREDLENCVNVFAQRQGGAVNFVRTLPLPEGR